MSSLKSKTPRGFERVPKKPDQHRFILFNFQVAILQKYKIYLSWDQFSPSSETEAARRFLECDLCQSNARKSCKYSYPQNQRLDFCQEEEKKWCVCVWLHATLMFIAQNKMLSPQYYTDTIWIRNDNEPDNAGVIKNDNSLHT